MKPLGTAVLGLMCLCAALCPAGAQQAESPLEKNRALMKKGEYRAAMLGFLDMVIADPDDSRARRNLKLAGVRVLKRERAAALAERKRLLAEAADSRRLILALRAAKKKRAALWKKIISKAVSLAGNINTVKEAVGVFEQGLEATPVYSDNKKDFLEALARIKEAFYGTIKSKYPYLVQGRTSVDSRDMAALTFSRDSLSDNTGRFIETDQAQKIMERADRLRSLERRILQHYRLVERGMELYRRAHYAESMACFREALAFDASNEEALFYMERAQKRLGLERAGEELK